MRYLTGWRQPLPVERLDRAHPLAPDLVCIVANQGAYGGVDELGNEWATEGTPGERGGRQGLATRFTTGQSWTNTTVLLPTTACSIVMVVNSEDVNAQGSVCGNLDNAELARCQVHLPYVGGIYWDFGGFTAGVSRLSYTPAGGFWGTWHHMAFTAGPRGMAIYEDGETKTSHTTAASRQAGSPATGFQVGKWNTQHDTAQIESLFVYSRQLNAAEVAALVINPYQMFTTPSPFGGRP